MSGAGRAVSALRALIVSLIAAEAVLVLLVAVLALGGSSPADAAQSKMYWVSNPGLVQRANLDGTEVEVLVDDGSPAQFADIALDVGAGKMYWAADFSIERANLDGTARETILTSLIPVGLDVAPIAGKVYVASGTEIRRANLDGSGEEVVLTGVLSTFFDVAVDEAGGKVYWAQFSDGTNGFIRRANLDGSSPEVVVVTAKDGPFHLDLDRARGKVYWTMLLQGEVQRANFDGSELETIATGVTNNFGIAVDAPSYKVYWSGSSVRRANADGSCAEELFVTPQGALGIALDLSGGPEASGPCGPNPVGGSVGLLDVDDGVRAASNGGGSRSVVGYVAALAGVVGAAMVGGGWYARRRWLR